MRDIHPATVAEIQKISYEAYTFAANAKDEDYGRGRTAEKILIPGNDYAELPGFGGRSAMEIVKSLPVGSIVLDVGCGYGELGADIKKINPGVEVYGFDAQAQNGQERLVQVVTGNVDDLAPETFSGKQFDLIVSSALLYHLPDYWGAVLRMSLLLKPQGILLASTMPRIVASGGTPHYFRNRNIFNTNGGLIEPEMLVRLLNRQNQHFVLQYSLASAALSAVNNVGGQLAGRRTSASGTLNLSAMFYCLYDDKLGYMIAQTPAEAEQLSKEGFLAVTRK